MVLFIDSIAPPEVVEAELSDRDHIVFLDCFLDSQLKPDGNKYGGFYDQLQHLFDIRGIHIDLGDSGSKKSRVAIRAYANELLKRHPALRHVTRYKVLGHIFESRRPAGELDEPLPEEKLAVLRERAPFILYLEREMRRKSTPPFPSSIVAEVVKAANYTKDELAAYFDKLVEETLPIIGKGGGGSGVGGPNGNKSHTAQLTNCVFTALSCTLFANTVNYFVMTDTPDVPTGNFVQDALKAKASFGKLLQYIPDGHVVKALALNPVLKADAIVQLAWECRARYPLDVELAYHTWAKLLDKAGLYEGVLHSGENFKYTNATVMDWERYHFDTISELSRILCSDAAGVRTGIRLLCIYRGLINCTMPGVTLVGFVKGVMLISGRYHDPDGRIGTVVLHELLSAHSRRLVERTRSQVEAAADFLKDNHKAEGAPDFLTQANAEQVKQMQDAIGEVSRLFDALQTQYS